MVTMPVWFASRNLLFVHLERLVVGLVLVKDRRDVQSELTVDVRESSCHLPDVLEDDMVRGDAGGREE